MQVLANELENNSIVIEQNTTKESKVATVKKFDLLNDEKLEDYNKSFKLDNSKDEVTK